MPLKIERNPAGWPSELLPVFENSLTCEFASLTRQATPITFPLTPYFGDDERTLDVSTGLTYPAKAERARRNPKVGLLFSDPVGSHLQNQPVVLVTGLATVTDRDIQANTDRYLRLSFMKSPNLAKSTPAFVARLLDFYFARIWIKITPLRMLWWPEGRFDQTPQQWDAPPGTQAPPSDPPPAGKQPPPWTEAPRNWHDMTRYSAQKLGLPILTVVGEDGFPLLARARTVALTDDGFALELPVGLPSVAGAACLTFHSHPEVFTGQENRAFVGQAVPDGSQVRFVVERPLADWSLGGSQLQTMMTMLLKRRQLRPRLVTEAARRGQPVPKINLPEGF